MQVVRASSQIYRLQAEKKEEKKRRKNLILNSVYLQLEKINFFLHFSADRKVYGSFATAVKPVLSQPQVGLRFGQKDEKLHRCSELTMNKDELYKVAINNFIELKEGGSDIFAK